MDTLFWQLSNIEIPIWYSQRLHKSVEGLVWEDNLNRLVDSLSSAIKSLISRRRFLASGFLLQHVRCPKVDAKLSWCLLATSSVSSNRHVTLLFIFLFLSFSIGVWRLFSKKIPLMLNPEWNRHLMITLKERNRFGKLVTKLSSKCLNFFCNSSPSCFAVVD